MTSRRKGFSLLETVIVILIIGILAAVAVPRYVEMLNNYRADLAQQQLISDLKLAIALAKSQSSQQRIVFTTSDQVDGGRYYLDGYPDPDHIHMNKETRLDQPPYVVTLDSSPSEISFDMYGVPDISGTWIINQDTAYQRTVVVLYPTGEINTL